tara:strand:- start:255 stop:641 length:387 start_codon:yes stop_codon:yes gene_type:complete
MTKKMDEIFNIETIVPDTKVTKDIEVIEESVDIDTDYKYARENLYNIIERGSDALNELVEIAGQSQSPRAYEIVGQMIKTLTDANKDLLEVQKKVKDLKKQEGGPKNVTNALFVGNTTELQRMLKDIK